MKFVWLPRVQLIEGHGYLGLSELSIKHIFHDTSVEQSLLLLLVREQEFQDGGDRWVTMSLTYENFNFWVHQSYISLTELNYLNCYISNISTDFK